MLAVDVSQAMGADLAIAKRALMSLAQQKIIEVRPPPNPLLLAPWRVRTVHKRAQKPFRSEPPFLDPRPCPPRLTTPCKWLIRLPPEQMGSKTKMGLVLMGSTGRVLSFEKVADPIMSSTGVQAGSQPPGGCQSVKSVFVCAETKHEILDENNEMSEGWDNVMMARGIEQTDILHMEAINNLETEEAECSCKWKLKRTKDCCSSCEH